jgi:hypothetical protein
MTDSRWQRFLTVLFPAFLPPLQLLLFGPHTIYVGNQQEFSAPFWSLAVHLAPMILYVAGGLALLGVALPTRLFRSYVVGLFGIGIVLWIQGNLIVGNYGALNGEDIDWSGHAWRSRHELALWIGLPVLATIAARKVFPIAVSVSRVLVALQLVLLAFTAAQADPEARAKWQGPPDEMFELSSTQNVFHFVLDGFQSDVFHDIVEAGRAEIDRQFAGFSFFPNHAGAFPTTIVSIPAMLTGAVYRNQEPMRPYMSRQFERASLFGVMRAQGYQVDAVSGLKYDTKSVTNFYRLQRPYVTYDAYTRFAAWELADLALFRHSPHLLKPTIYNGQSWRLQTIFGQTANTTARRHPPVTGEAFLNDFTARVRVGHNRPLYTYLHVGVPHWPMVLNADCEYIGVKSVTREIYTGQARCAVKRVGELLARLRDLGLYDSSVIVVSSDHGIALPPREFTGDRDVFGGPLSVVAGSALALLMVKPPHSTGPLRVSEAPTTISDIPATIVDILGLKNPFPGTPALKLDERAVRTRSFAEYFWGNTGWDADYFSYMDVFTIEGRVLDGNAWTLGDPIYAPGLDPAERSRGFYGPERDSRGMVFRWSSPLAFLHAPPDARGVALMVRSVAPMPQTVTVEIRGEVIDRVTLSDHEWRALRYPIRSRVKSATAGAEWMVFRVDPPWRVGGDRRTFGVMTRNLKWTN